MVSEHENFNNTSYEWHSRNIEKVTLISVTLITFKIYLRLERSFLFFLITYAYCIYENVLLKVDRCVKPEIYGIIWHLSTLQTEITAKRALMKNNRIRMEQNAKERNEMKQGNEELLYPCICLTVTNYLKSFLNFKVFLTKIFTYPF